MKRYEVHWARLDPVLGSEIGKSQYGQYLLHILKHRD